MDGSLLPPRGNRAIFSGIFLVTVSTLVSFLYLEVAGLGYSVAVYPFCVSNLVMILGEMLRRTCLFVEEWRHLRQRYGDSWFKVFTKAFSFRKNDYHQNNHNGTIFFLFVLFAIGACVTQPNSGIVDHGGKYFLLLFQNIAIVPMIGYLSGLRAPTAVEISEMHEKYNKNLADGLAWSYYFGYLKLVLPELERARTKATQKVRELLESPVKLHILIPMNCLCPKELSEFDKNIKVYYNLPPIKKSRGGVQLREYHHTVYEITIQNEHTMQPDGAKYAGEHYCLAEYATPLLTLYDMSKDIKAQLSKDERLNQVKLFRDKLKVILDDDLDCKGKYELVELHENFEKIALPLVQRMKSNTVEIYE